MEKNRGRLLDMKYCPNCGNELKDGANVCLGCGKILACRTPKKATDKNLIIAIAIGVGGVILLFLFWFIIAIFIELDAEEINEDETRKYCCIEAGGTWSDGSCRMNYWFDEDEYDSCIYDSF